MSSGGLFAQCLQSGVLGSAFVFEFGEPVTQSSGPGVSCLVTAGEAAGFALVEEVVLTAGDLGDRLLDRGDLLFDVVAVAGVVVA
ncbi:hypothetical protein ACW9HR_37470 [Nocardia gipuzkoensis]